MSKLDKKSFELLFRENFTALTGFVRKYVKVLGRSFRDSETVWELIDDRCLGLGKISYI